MKLKSAVKFLVAVVLGSGITLGGLVMITPARNPFLPTLGDPASRQAVFTTEMAKYPEANCKSITELYVETGITPNKGQMSLWHVRCNTGLIVCFIFDKEGALVKAVPEGF